MVVRDKTRTEPPHQGERYTQIAVMEDGIVVEHFVTSASSASLVGNIYLGIVQNVGYPNPNRSHFRSTEIWETASDSAETLPTGYQVKFIGQAEEFGKTMQYMVFAFSLAMILLAQVYGHAGQRDKVAPLLAQAAAAGGYACPYESAAAWLSIGERERAFTLLDEAVAKRSNCLVFLRVDPRMQPLRAPATSPLPRRRPCSLLA